jgi:soluble lytic murein transglycosylase
LFAVANEPPEKSYGFKSMRFALFYHGNVQVLQPNSWQRMLQNTIGFCAAATLALFAPALFAAPALSAQDPLEVADAQYQLAVKRAYSGLPVATEALERHVLRPYIEYYQLQRAPKTTDVASAKAWLKRYGDELPVAPMLRRKLLASYANGRPADYVALYRERDANSEERCRVWSARMALAPDAARGTQHALALYRDASTPPLACAAAFKFLRDAGKLNTADAQARFTALLQARQLGAASSVLPDLVSTGQSTARAALLAETDAYKVLAAASRWPAADTELMTVLARALERIAAVNPVLAAAKLEGFIASHSLSETLQLRVRAVIVRTAVIANLPDAGAWLDDLPASARDAQTSEWGVRRALSALNPQLALARVQAMPPELGNTARWQYIRGRLLQWLGQPSQASAAFQSAATDATFYGFLAADRLESGYALCPMALKFAPKLSGPLLASGALKRIAAFKRLHDRVGAKREWMFLLGRLSVDERRQAGLLAAMEGWGEYAILALNAPADRTLYQARFPLLQAEILTEQARHNGLDDAFIAGLIRQESAWDPNAISRANALGLMQMLPGTAALTAKAVGFGAKVDLFNPTHNITLGTAHLRLLSEKYAGSPILMTAAYNAGPRAVAKWQNALYTQYPDLWIETIPYKETRDYVTAVLAFSVIYDWRLDGKLQRLSARIPEFPRVAAPALTACAAAR